MKIIASIGGLFAEYDSFSLVPYRLVFPDFLPHNHAAAKMMAEDLVEDGFCDNVWVWEDGNPWPGSSLVWQALKGIDWADVPELKYDLETKDSWGDRRWEPWEMWTQVADRTKRCRALEPHICGHRDKAERYAKDLLRSEWKGWTLDELRRNPCWAFYYAKDVCKGRLPEALDNMMTMLSFQEPDNPWVKRYFGTKRYRKRNRKALSEIAC